MNVLECAGRMLIFRILKLSSTANYSKHMTLIRHQCQCWFYPYNLVSLLEEKTRFGL